MIGDKGEGVMPRSDSIETAAQKAREFIAQATDALKGPMSNTERALLVADRRDARDFLASLPSPPRV